MTLRSLAPALLAVSLAAAFAASAPQAAVTPAAGDGTVFIRAARLLDVRSGKWIENPGIRVENGRITAVASGGEPAPGERVVDLAGMSLLPGLIDMHTHLDSDPAYGGYTHLQYTDRFWSMLSVKHAGETLDAGFTTVRNVGADAWNDIGLRQAVDEGKIRGPRIVTAGYAFGATGGHCDSTFFPPSFDAKSPYNADSPDEARKLAREHLAHAHLGKDPGAEKAERREAITVGELIDEWLAGPGLRGRRGNLRKAYDVNCDRGRLENHVRPVLGKLKVRDLKKGDIERLRDSIAAGRTAKTTRRGRFVSKVSGGEGAATRTLRTVGSLLTYAVEQSYLSQNPRKGVLTTPDRSCERFLSASELENLGKVISTSPADPRALAIIRLWALTGCRHREIAGLRWAQVDFDLRFLRLGQIKGVQRNVFLTEPALEVLEGVHRIEGCEWVFLSDHGGGHYSGAAKVWRDIRKAAGLDDVRVHDLRHTFASQSLAAGASLEVIGALLGHRELRTTRRYAHLAATSVHAAAEVVASVIGRSLAVQR
ncbi:tyrosine-type recombinase/integrase [Brevundimonas sp.]|uniref:tyrosine-type recombinase/integrase n=1 Tax=Brevundimonas sp. TaxID=1871086 RepID=UPI0025D81FEB|nr:tyrosine-type recombinase/integrase [Brevundimonas sp.]